jgi:hypothetical protein
VKYENVYFDDLPISCLPHLLKVLSSIPIVDTIFSSIWKRLVNTVILLSVKNVNDISVVNGLGHLNSKEKFLFSALFPVYLCIRRIQVVRYIIPIRECPIELIQNLVEEKYLSKKYDSEQYIHHLI